MNAVLLSIAPNWCELIASGQKTIEVRKTKPKIETPFKCYIYCTKHSRLWQTMSGKVIGEFVCDQIMEFDAPGGLYRVTPNFIENECCLSMTELQEYGYDSKTNYYKNLYGWHISDLVIYDKPKELDTFYRDCGDNPKCHNCECSYYERTEEGSYYQCVSSYERYKPITRPPQSWCYVEEVKT